MVEWQTRQLQELMGATLCRFKSCYPHLFFCLFISIFKNKLSADQYQIVGMPIF